MSDTRLTVAVSNDFFKAFNKLPEKSRGKVATFISKFRDDAIRVMRGPMFTDEQSSFALEHVDAMIDEACASMGKARARFAGVL